MILEVDNKVLSLDILKSHFSCNLKKCKGICCVHGDSGAPLEKEEAEILDKIYPVVKDYLTEEGNNSIEKNGTSFIDKEGDLVTTLINGKACAFVNYDKDKIAYCGIEKAYFDQKVDFRKPVSCHLYPVRTKKYERLEAMNYDQWDICKPAKVLGKRDGVLIYRFVKDAIIRKYGKTFFEQLEYAEKNLDQDK